MKYKVYHRKANHRTQTNEDARKQLISQEIWGRPPYGSNIPKVQAYEEALPSGINGIEFCCEILPDANTPPGMAYWSIETPGVRFDGLFAILPVTIILVRIEGVDIHSIEELEQLFPFDLD